MTLEILLEQNVVDKAFIAVPIIFRRCVRKRDIPGEIIILLLKPVKIFDIEHLSF